MRSAVRRLEVVPMRLADVPAPAPLPADTEAIKRALEAEGRRRKAPTGRILHLAGSGSAPPGASVTNGTITVHPRAAAAEPRGPGQRE
jgi:hypothetical protein